MISTRLRKVWRDLWGNPLRTGLAVVALAVGIFSVGAVHGTQMLLSQELNRGYQARKPASIILYLGGLIDPKMVKSVRRMPAVLDAEGRRSIDVRAKVGADRWRDMVLEVLQDYTDPRLNRVQSKGGAWPPPNRTLLIERASLAVAGAQLDDPVEVTASNWRTVRTLSVSGIVHDMNKEPSQIGGRLYGYITFDTLAWLGHESGFNQLHLLVNSEDKAEIRQMVESVEAKLARAGYTVGGIWLPTPDVHPIDEIVQPLLALLNIFGALALSFSAVLIVNTISAIVAQQIPQIGIMKAVGARRGQIAGLYLGFVLIVALLALLIAVPLGAAASYLFTRYLAQLLNFDVTGMGFVSQTVYLQAAVGLAVPLLTALWPIWQGSRVSVRQALTYQGLGTDHFGQHWLDRMVGHIRWLSRPLLIALRNTVRRRARLLGTLAVLILAGATFVTAFNMHASIQVSLAEFFGYWNYDVRINFVERYRPEKISQASRGQPIISEAEPWSVASATFMEADDRPGHTFTLSALPPASSMIQPSLVAGRWLLPEDENAIVIDTEVLSREPAFGLGQSVRLQSSGRTDEWRVIGIVKPTLSLSFRSANLYVSHPAYVSMVHQQARTNSLRLVTMGQSAEDQLDYAATLEEYFNRAGLRVRSVQTSSAQQEAVRFQFNLMLSTLFVTALLLVLASAIGLMGTISMNVLERTREIGIMRAIGASNGTILRLFIVEGICIGLLSWPFGVLLAYPISYFLAGEVGRQFAGAPFEAVTSGVGITVWLVVLIGLAIVASYFPARSAAQMTVRDVLDYE